MIELQPLSTDGWYHKGFALYHKKQFSEAVCAQTPKSQRPRIVFARLPNSKPLSRVVQTLSAGVVLLVVGFASPARQAAMGLRLWVYGLLIAVG